MNEIFPLVGAVALTAPAGALLVRTGRDRLMRDRLRDTVIVTLKSGAAFRGVLFEVDDRSLILRETVAFESTDTGVRTPVDGEMVLARSDVHYIQRP